MLNVCNDVPKYKKYILPTIFQITYCIEKIGLKTVYYANLSRLVFDNYVKDYLNLRLL